jgi:hypothetical protein
MAVEEPFTPAVPGPVRRAGWVATALVVVVFAVLVSEGSPGGLVRRGPFTSDFFDEQAAALLDGRLDVDPEVAGLEGFVHDGRTHLYFGLVPSILRLPVVAITQRFDGRLTQLSMLLALAVACWATTRLAWRARRWRRGDGPLDAAEPWIVGALTLAVGLASPLLFLASRPVVYHETELWGAALALVAAEAALRWWERSDARSLAWASAAATVALGTHGSVGSGAVAALALTVGLGLVTRRVPWRRAPLLALAVVAPLLPYVAVNQARFDHPVGIPFADQVLSSFDPARQATLEATGGSLFGPEFAPTAVVAYLRPDGVDIQRLFPWITFREGTAVIGSPTFDTVDRSASIPAVAPSLTLLAAIGIVALLGRGWRDPWLAVVVGALAGTVSTVTIAFIANRYLADAVPALVPSAALGTWTVADRLRGEGIRRRRLAVGGLAGLTLAGTVVSLALAVQAQRLFILPRDGARAGFVELQYALHERLVGGRPPSVTPAAEVPNEPGPRGSVVVAGRCRSLHWSDGRRWWPLELGREDGWAIDGGPLQQGRTTLLRAPAWSLVAEVEGARARLRYEGLVERTGGWHERGEVEGELAVWLDRVNAELTVRGNDGPLLEAWLVDLTGPAEGAGPRAAGPLPTPFCDDLARRLRR